MIPSAMHQMVQHPDLERTDFSSLRVVLTGAAYTPPALAEKFKSHVKSVSHINEGALFRSTYAPDLPLTPRRALQATARLKWYRVPPPQH